MKMTKEAIHDTIESRIKIAHAKLETLSARAGAAKAALSAVASALKTKRAIDQKLDQLKTSSEATYEQTRADVESRVAELEKAVQAIEAKFKAA